MNQEQNNFNMNTSNSQGNNGIPNNQPLTNQNSNNTFTGINQQINTNQSQNQINIQQPTPQPTNYYEGGINNNQIKNTKQPKKTNIGLIIGIIVLVAAIAGGILLFNNKKGNNSLTNNNSTGDSIAKIDIGVEYVVALTNSGKYYAIGKNSYSWVNKGEDLKEPTLLAENVKSFTNGGRFYISNEGDLYISGVNAIEGGIYKEYKKLGSNIKKVSGSDLGLVALSNDGKLYAYGLEEYSGFGKKYTELTLIDDISNVTDVYKGISTFFYLTDKNELYGKYTGSNAPFEKILDNVDHCTLNSATTKDGKIYAINYSSDEKRVIAKLIDGADGIIDNWNKLYFTQNNIILDDSNYKYETYRYYYPKDVKTMLFMNDKNKNSKGVMKFIYLTKNNKLSLQYIEYEEHNYKNKLNEKTETLDYNIESLSKIQDFLSN